MWLTCPWHVVECSKKANPEVELITDIDMLLMAKKEIKVECVLEYTNMQKQMTNTWKIVIVTKNFQIKHFEV